MDTWQENYTDLMQSADWSTLLSDPTINGFIHATYFNTSLLGPKRDSLYIVIPITIIYAIIFFTGVIGNISTCIVIARNKSMHTATNYYLFSLAVSDLLLLVTGLPQEMYSIWSRYPYVFGEAFCILRGLASETSANATVLTITAFTVERYVAICHPFLSHTMSKLSRAIKLILTIWLVAFCFAVPQALQFGIVNTGTIECMVKQVIIEHSFELSTFLFFIAPMTLITVLYALIGYRLRKSNMMKRNTRNDRINVNNTTRKSCRHQHGQSSRRVLKMLVAVVVAFFICWAPFHAQRLVAIYGRSLEAEPPYKLKLYEIITYVSGVLYYVSTTVNPVLYHIMSNKFREAFKETFSRCCWWCSSSVRGNRSGSHMSERRSCYSVLSRSGGGAAAGNTPMRTVMMRSTSRNATAANHAAHESTDSGTSCSHRHSDDSTCMHPAAEQITTATAGHGYLARHDTQESSVKESEKRNSELEPYDPIHPIIALHKLNAHQYDNQTSYRNQRSRAARFLQIFRCIAKRTLDEKKINRYDSPVSDHNDRRAKPNDIINERLHGNFCDMSNSSLKDIEHGALEDELTIYMKEIERREKDKS